MLNLTLQDFIFNAPDRMSLTDYVPASTKEIKISIYRNHSFELVEHTIKAYLDFADIKAEFIYSDYDDSLSFLNLDNNSDLLILWLDMDRYAIADVEGFIKERLGTLKTIYKKAIIGAFFGNANFDFGMDIVNFSFEKYRQQFGEKFYNFRLEAFSGTKMSPELCMAVSKDLGLNYIPAVVRPNLKAIILDLDNTLYKGVLGEDGYQNICLTEGHRLLQERIKELREQGFFLAVASKNNEADVLEMFDKRADFPLKKEDFSKIMCSWESKAESIQKISEFLNIGIDSMLFVDDNVGELITVNQQLPDVKFLLAQVDAEETVEILNNYPGLLKLRTEFEDSIRSSDIEANETRRQLQVTLSAEDYIRSLEMSLVFHMDDEQQITRISELANKTNQFIFNYRRFTVADIEELMKRPEAAVIAVELADKLSNSGIVGVCVAEKVQDYLEIKDCFVSCRALGRGIDEMIVSGAISIAQNCLGLDRVLIDFQKGTRNVPAEKYVAEHFYENSQTPLSFEYQFPENLVKIEIKRS